MHESVRQRLPRVFVRRGLLPGDGATGTPRELDPEDLLYASTQPGGTGPLRLTPLQLLDRLAALIPPPHVHRYRYLAC